ncbi:MAG: ribonuclease HII [Flavobacteriales bacterium]|nr:ribonuclease HII [Flavobacteriales bacterium]MBL6869963.1 ribonuclease HII [Flavobacteriales bacterium]
MKLKPFLTSFTEAGCDEAGRGCLAGPVVAAAVILPRGYKNIKLDDSKKISEKNRNELRIDIVKNAIAIGIGIVEERKIEKINILQASLLAMHLAIKNLADKPSHLAIDGNKFNPYPKIDHTCIIKGDGKYMNIAAASIIAKTKRDEIMKKLSISFPEYLWDQNKGYPTKKHKNAISEFGITKHHRKSFKLT